MDLEQRLREELGELARASTTAPDAYARIMDRVAAPPAGPSMAASWRARAIVLAAVAALVVGAVALTAQSDHDPRPNVVTQPPGGPPELVGRITAAVDTNPCEGDCIDSTVTFDLPATDQLATVPTERWGAVEVLPDGRYVLPGGEGLRASLVGAGTNTIDLGAGTVQSLATAPDGDLVMLAFPGGSAPMVLRTVDPSTGAIADQALPDRLQAVALDVAADGTVVLLGDHAECCLNDARLVLLPPSGSPRTVDLGDVLRVQRSPASRVGVTLSPQGLVAISERWPAPLAIGGVEHPGWTVVFDQDGGLLATLDGWQGLAWSPDGSGLLTAQRSGERSVDLRVWFGHDLAQHIDLGGSPLPLTPIDWAPQVVDGEPLAPAVEDGPVVYLLGPSATEASVLRFSDLVRTQADVTPADVAERITAALRAAATPSDQQLAAGMRAPLSEIALPAVMVDGDLAVLDWDPEAAQAELGIWSTSAGSAGLNPIAGMVFDNAPGVQAIEHRVAGSCERFTEMMQGSGCHRDTRSRWEAFTSDQ